MAPNNASLNVLSVLCAKLNRSQLNSTAKTDPPPNGTTSVFAGSPPPADIGAVLYIVAVLIFYSAAIVVMIVKYLKSEQRELHEDILLENFFRKMPSVKYEKEQQVNQVAIRAFHTLTTASYQPKPFPGRRLLVTDV